MIADFCRRHKIRTGRILWLPCACRFARRPATVLGSFLLALALAGLLGLGVSAPALADEAPVVPRESRGFWQPVESPNDMDLYDVDFLAPDAGWAVGQTGIIVHYNGATWAGNQLYSGEDLLAVDMIAPDEGWAVGPGGALLRRTDAGWTEETSPTDGNPWAISLVRDKNAPDTNGFCGLCLYGQHKPH